MIESLRVARKIAEGRRLLLLSKKQARVPSLSNRASSMGHPCARYLYYLRTDAVSSLPETSDELQGIFEEGHLHEEDIKRQLHEMGFRGIYGTQSGFPANTYQLSGHVDAILPLASSPGLVIEAKSLNPYHFAAIRELEPGVGDAESVKNHAAQYIRGHFTQTQLYMFLADTTEGLLLYKNKGTGAWLAVPLPQDLDHVQGCLERAEIVNKALRSSNPSWQMAAPPFVEDRSICLRCPFAKVVCRPPGLDVGDGLQLYHDEQAEADCKTICEQGGAAKEYDRARDRLRELLRFLVEGKDRLMAIGDYLVTVKHNKRGMLVDVQPLKQEEEKDGKAAGDPGDNEPEDPLGP